MIKRNIYSTITGLPTDFSIKSGMLKDKVFGTTKLCFAGKPTITTLN